MLTLLNNAAGRWAKFVLVSQEKRKMKWSPTFSYNLPYDNYEKKSSYEVEDIRPI